MSAEACHFVRGRLVLSRFRGGLSPKPRTRVLGSAEENDISTATESVLLLIVAIYLCIIGPFPLMAPSTKLRMAYLLSGSLSCCSSSWCACAPGDLPFEVRGPPFRLSPGCMMHACHKLDQHPPAKARYPDQCHEKLL